MRFQLLKNLVYIFLIFTTYTQFLQAQSKMIFTVSSDSLVVNNFIVVKYSLEGTDSEFKKPDFTGWNVVSGPNVSSQMSIMNGVVSKSIVIQFTVLMDKVGDFVLPLSSVIFQNKEIDIPSIKIIVSPSSPHSSEGQIATEREMVLVQDLKQEANEKTDKKRTVRQLKKI